MRLSELYTSVQCEGPNTGRMVQFVRFAGCNMRCPLWPCDTEHAINPAIWQKEAEQLDAEQLFDKVNAAPWDLCLTGGEPFMQRVAQLQEFVEMSKAGGYQIECFTNGSFPFPSWAIRNLQFIMDWKLKGSGEAETNLVERTHNAMLLKRSDNIKFVVTDEADLAEAWGIWKQLYAAGCEAQFWVGAAWGRYPVQAVIDFIEMMQLPWKLNVQVHKYIWHPDERGV